MQASVHYAGIISSHEHNASICWYGQFSGTPQSPCSHHSLQYTYCMWLYSNVHQLSTNEVPMITVDDCIQPTSNQISPLATTYCGFLVQTTTGRENTADKETRSDHRTKCNHIHYVTSHNIRPLPSGGNRSNLAAINCHPYKNATYVPSPNSNLTYVSMACKLYTHTNQSFDL